MAFELFIGFKLDEHDLEKICDCWNEEVTQAEPGSYWEDRGLLTLAEIKSNPALADYISAQILSHLSDYWGDVGMEMVYDADIFSDLEDHR